jgi:hypothetical protein
MLVTGRRLGATFWDECETWPKGKFNDQVDAAAGAFKRLVSSTTYNNKLQHWL